MPHGEGGTLWEEATARRRREVGLSALAVRRRGDSASRAPSTGASGPRKAGPRCPTAGGAQQVLRLCSCPSQLRWAQESSTRGTSLSPEDGREPDAPVVLATSFLYSCVAGSQGLIRERLFNNSDPFRAPACPEATGAIMAAMGMTSVNQQSSKAVVGLFALLSPLSCRACLTSSRPANSGLGGAGRRRFLGMCSRCTDRCTPGP